MTDYKELREALKDGSARLHHFAVAGNEGLR